MTLQKCNNLNTTIILIIKTLIYEENVKKHLSISCGIRFPNEAECVQTDRENENDVKQSRHMYTKACPVSHICNEWFAHSTVQQRSMCL